MNQLTRSFATYRTAGFELLEPARAIRICSRQVFAGNVVTHLAFVRFPERACALRIPSPVPCSAGRFTATVGRPDACADPVYGGQAASLVFEPSIQFVS
jgi:hypothetical protein